MSAAPVVVVGGGITGLAAAHALVERARSGEPVPPVRLVEGSGRFGGQVRTERIGDFLLEAGPDTLVAQKPAAIRLCERLGLRDEIEDVAARHGGTEILWAGRLHRVPEGFAMIAPTKLGPVFRSSLFTLPGALRMALERFVPARPGSVEDESLASFVLRRFGREALDRAAEPIAASLFTADAERLSLRATMPRFLDVERAHGSVARGMASASTATHAPPGARPGAFFTLRPGLARLVDALVASIPEAMRGTGAAVETISRGPAGLHLKLTDGRVLDASAVVLACPAFEGARILRGLDPQLASQLDALAYASCATVSLVYRRKAIGRALSSFGFFVPKAQGLPILACSYVTEKFPARAPHEVAVVRAFLGGATRPEILDGDDLALARAADGVLREVLAIREAPLAAFTFRYPRSMPQYEVGAASWLADVRRRADAIPGLYLAGSLAGAVGIPDCVRSGEEAAGRVTSLPGASGWVANHANQYA